MIEITENIAEVLILQEKIFNENFIKFMKFCIKASDEKRSDINEIADSMAKIMNGKNRTVCLFIMTYMIAKSFTLKEYNDIESFIGNNIF